MSKLTMGVLLLMLLVLQYRLWIDEGGVSHTAQLKQELQLQQQTNAELERRNERLVSEIAALKSGTQQIEAKAREELGLVKQDETFFLLIGEEAEAGFSHQYSSSTADLIEQKP